MRINADPSKRAVADSGALPWVASPLPGVERRMLEREGGEELFVLEGACRDAGGGYGKGGWVRSPVGRALHSGAGCRLHVKRGHLADPPSGPK
jgi:hypothetical protein